jgi:hypothetical protein
MKGRHRRERHTELLLLLAALAFVVISWPVLTSGRPAGAAGLLTHFYGTWTAVILLLCLLAPRVEKDPPPDAEDE